MATDRSGQHRQYNIGYSKGFEDGRNGMLSSIRSWYELLREDHRYENPVIVIHQMRLVLEESGGEQK